MSETRRFTTYQGEITVEIDGQSYVGRPMTVDEAEAIYGKPDIKPREVVRGQVAATFGLDSSMLGRMQYAVYDKLVALMLVINGLKPVEGDAPVGEAQAAGSTSA